MSLAVLLKQVCPAAFGCSVCVITKKTDLPLMAYFSDIPT